MVDKPSHRLRKPGEVHRIGAPLWVVRRVELRPPEEFFLHLALDGRQDLGIVAEVYKWLVKCFRDDR